MPFKAIRNRTNFSDEMGVFDITEEDLFAISEMERTFTATKGNVARKSPSKSRQGIRLQPK